MKKLTALFLSILAIVTINPSLVYNKGYAQEKVLFPVGLTYNSIYWWRGIELNGKGVGVLWPKVGIEVSGLTAYVAAGINEDYLMATETGDRKLSKTYHEFDYGVEYALTLDSLSSTVGVKYTHYPFYDSAGATVDPSFIEAYIIASYTASITPGIELYYDYFVEENADKNPVNEDIYAKFSLTKECISTQGFVVKIGAWLAYYNNAYLNKKGFSDTGVTATFSYDYNGITFFSAFNYARTLAKDFYVKQDFDANGKDSILKNHLWADVGVSTKL